MEKIIKYISVLLIIFLVSACKKNEEFFVTYMSNDLKLNRVFQEEIYGKYNNFFESENCAFGDKDVTYIYNDLEVEAYENKRREMIVYSIVFTSQDVNTNEGIKLYDSVNDMIKVYGEGFKKEDNKYTYQKGNTLLVFITQNDIIESIEYCLDNIE